MRMQNFNTMLFHEVQTGRMAVVTLLQERDRLLYVEAPPLRRKYMELIGDEERKVLEEELEVSVLRRKAELMQIAVNRQEALDIEALEAQLAEERRKLLGDLEDADATLNELPELSEEDAKELSNRYKEIVWDFHPAVHKDLTETERELFDRAAEAYRHQNLEALKLVHDILYRSTVELELAFNVSAGNGSKATPEEIRERYLEEAGTLTTDYTLAKSLFSCFCPTEEDGVVLNYLGDMNQKRRGLMDEIDSIRAGFPFNAAETMNDLEKTQEYLLELKVRAKMCAREREKLEERIEQLTEVMGVG